MRIYEISAFSECGSYFESYLKTVLCIEITKEKALSRVKDWCSKEENYTFIRDITIDDVCDCGQSDHKEARVVGYVMESDY